MIKHPRGMSGRLGKPGQLGQPGQPGRPTWPANQASRARPQIGGHHRPFNDLGYAGIRIMEAHENYTQQHQDIRIENGIAYGDTFEHVNFGYAKKLTAVNAITMASLALAPPAPEMVAIGGIVQASAKLKWNKVNGAKGYKIYW